MRTILRIHFKGSETYDVSPEGRITRYRDGKLFWRGSDAWVFLGFSEHNWSNRITYPLAAIFADGGARLNNPRLYGWDVDHGTTRQWRSPRIASAYLLPEGRD